MSKRLRSNRLSHLAYGEAFPVYRSTPVKQPTVNATPVIIRAERSGHAADMRALGLKPKSMDRLIAIFPAEIGTSDPSTMACYSTVEGHSHCASDYAGKRTKPATAAQVKAMLAELHRAGYRNLKVVKRSSSAHAAARRKHRA